MANIITQSGPLAATGVLWLANVSMEDGVTVHVVDSGGGSTIVAEVSDDNSTWIQVGSVTTTGRFFYAADYKYFRVRVATYVSGNVRVGVDATTVGPRTLASSALTAGTSFKRPSSPLNGFSYFDTTLRKPLRYYAPTGEWIDPTGVAVSSVAPPVLIEDFSNVAQWVYNPSSTSGSTLTQDGAGAIKLTTPATAASAISATKTYSPGLDVSKGGVMVLGVNGLVGNCQTTTVTLYLSSANFAASKFISKFTYAPTSIARGKQYLLFDLSTFTASGSESLANLMTQVRVRLDCPAGNSSVSFDDLWYIASPGKDRPRVCITFDDNWASQYTIAYPYMKSKGMAGTIYTIKNLVGTASYMTLAQLQECYAAGWDIGNHTTDHVAMCEANLTAITTAQTPVAAGAMTIDGTLASGGVAVLDQPRHVSVVAVGNEQGKFFTITGELAGQVKSEIVVGTNVVTSSTDGLFDKVTGVTVSAATAGAVSIGTARTAAEAYAAIKGCSDYLIANNMPRAAYHLAYPRGLTTPQSDVAVANAGILSARTTNRTQMGTTFGLVNRLAHPGQPIDTQATMKAYIDSAILSGGTVHWYVHKIDPATADSLTVLTADFQAVIDYIATKRDAGLIDVLTVTQWSSAVADAAYA